MSSVKASIATAKQLLAGYVNKDTMATARGVKKRALRAERQRGDGPPSVKISNRGFYRADGFRDWLKAIEQRPVRARKAA